MKQTWHTELLVQDRPQTRPLGAEMSSSNKLPLLVKAAFLWNRVAPRGRGFVPRHIGKLFGREADYVIETAHGARLRMDMSNLEVYAPIYNENGVWEPHVG